MSLMPDRYDFTIWRGATFRNTLTLYTAESTTSPPRDLTGYTALLEIYDQPQGNLLVSLTDTDGITLGDDAGTIELYLSASDTDTLTWEAGVYELSITAPGPGDTDILLFGHFKVKGL